MLSSAYSGLAISPFVINTYQIYTDSIVDDGVTLKASIESSCRGMDGWQGLASTKFGPNNPCRATREYLFNIPSASALSMVLSGRFILTMLHLV